MSFPSSVVSGRFLWQSLEVLQDVDKHDVCTVVFHSYFSSYSSTLGPGTPVVVQYGSRRRSASFIGNIAKMSPSRKIGSMYEHTIVCVAASRQLRVTARNTWRNKTGPEVVQEIGKKLGFKVVTKQHSLRKKTITQTGGSYWAFLTDLAKMCGYAIRVEDTTIYFLPIGEMVKLFSSSAPQASYGSSANKTNIIRFSASLGNTSDDPEDLADSATVTSFGPEDTGFVDVTEYPSSAVRGRKKYIATYERSNPRTIAYTREEARALAKGMADRGQMAYDAQLDCTGEPGLAPYHPVYIASGSSDTSGWWVVKRVRHYISDKKEYVCEAVVSTDEVSQQTSSPINGLPFRDVYTEAEYNLTVGSSILHTPEPNMVIGATYTANGTYGSWINTSPGTVLTPNNELLAPFEPQYTTYPSTSTFPGPTLYPAS